MFESLHAVSMVSSSYVSFVANFTFSLCAAKAKTLRNLPYLFCPIYDSPHSYICCQAVTVFIRRKVTVPPGNASASAHFPSTACFASVWQRWALLDWLAAKNWPKRLGLHSCITTSCGSNANALSFVQLCYPADHHYIVDC